MSSGHGCFSILHFPFSSAGSVPKMSLTRWYLANAILFLTNPAASETKHLSLVSSPWGWIPGLSRKVRPVGTQVPCFRGIPFTYDPCCPLQYFKFSVHNPEHVNAMHIVVPLYLSKEWQPSLHMFRSGAIISRSLSDPWLFASVVVKVTDTKCPLSSILQALLPWKL